MQKLNQIYLIMQQKQIQNLKGGDTSKFAKDVDLAGLKSNTYE